MSFHERYINFFVCVCVFNSCIPGEYNNKSLDVKIRKGVQDFDVSLRKINRHQHKIEQLQRT